jgi:putative restriction endonuclease
MPRICVAVTDNKWFDSLAAEANVDEVNFWQPGENARKPQLAIGDLFLFRLGAPRGVIAGGGYFVKYLRLPVSYAWTAYERKNGADSLYELRARIAAHRPDAAELVGRDFDIGCIMLASPFFLRPADWFAPPGWHRGTRSVKHYSTTDPDGARLLSLARERGAGLQFDEILAARDQRQDSALVLAKARPGQGYFRAVVADTYGWRCAVTGERVRPALEAAHIKEYAADGPNLVQNGLLLRADLHRLLDGGYVTVSPGYTFEVSRKVREDFENGRDYYAMAGRHLRLPDDTLAWPDPEFTAWHRENRYRA